MNAASGEPSTSGQAWVDGVLLDRAVARISIDDFGARYGAVAFETMIARHGAVFRLDAHLDRLERGLALLRADAPSRSSLAQAIDDTLAANGLREASVRLAVSAGAGRVPDLRATTVSAVTITADALPPPPAPVRLRVSSVRLDEHRAWRDAKVGQYLPYLLAREEARAAGADDALLLNYAGDVAEASTANVMALIGGTLISPDIESGALPGITAAAVIEVARGLGIPTAVASMRLDHTAQADALLLTSSVAGIREVAAVEAPGALSWRSRERARVTVSALKDGYEALVESECLSRR